MAETERTLDVALTTSSAWRAQRREPHLIVALECDRPSALSSRHRLGSEGCVTLGRGSARGATRAVDAGSTVLQLTIPDQRISSVHARLDGALGRWRITDLNSKNGMRV